MRSYLAIGFAVITLFAAMPTAAIAQDSVLAELYGHGVHAYFAGQAQQAHEYLTTAIDQGTRDPRAFYFRGLSYTALGRPDEANADFLKGAELETHGADRVYPVSHSLQRVQGVNRMAIERNRVQARIAARTKTVKATQARYESLEQAEGQVLRNPNRTQPAPAKELVGTPPAADESDPFGAGAPAAEPEAAPEVATPEAADAGNDLFGDAPAGDAMPADGGAGAFGEDAETDPFADDVPAEDMPEEPKSDSTFDDIFG